MNEPTSSDARNVLTISQLIERRRFDSAKRVLGEALARTPDDPALLYYSGYIDYREGRLFEAQAAIERILESNPRDRAGRDLLSDVLKEQGRHAEAEEVLLGLLREYPRDAGYYADYSLLMLKTLHVDKALQLAEEAIRLDPSHTQAQIASTLCAVVASPSREAERRLQALVQGDPDAAETALMMVIVLSDAGQKRAALRVARDLLRASPDDEEIVGIVKELTVQAHWSMAPLWPMIRFGWGGSAAMWGFGVGGLLVIQRTKNPTFLAVFLIVWLGYVVYSWIWPALLKRWIER